MGKRELLSLAGILAAIVILFWLGDNLTPSASRWLSDTMKIGIGLIFVGWVGWLALTANKRRR